MARGVRASARGEIRGKRRAARRRLSATRASYLRNRPAPTVRQVADTSADSGGCLQDDPVRYGFVTRSRRRRFGSSSGATISCLSLPSSKKVGHAGCEKGIVCVDPSAGGAASVGSYLVGRFRLV